MALGQLVRIFEGGGVNVRVPFVQVNVDPYGGTQVRAPFVRINSPPGYYQPQPYYGQPIYPGNFAPSYAPNGQPVYGSPIVQPPVGTPANIATVSPAIAEPGTVNEIPRTASRPATPPNPSEFKSVLTFEPADELDLPELRERLLSGAAELNQSMSQYSNGQLWQEHLRLPSFVGESTEWVNPVSISPEQLSQLEFVLGRFDRTSSKTELQLINKFESFHRVHRDLTSLVQRLQDQSFRNVEELPAPRQESDK
jgi:hypothetical protein